MMVGADLKMCNTLLNDILSKLYFHKNRFALIKICHVPLFICTVTNIKNTQPYTVDERGLSCVATEACLPETT